MAQQRLIFHIDVNSAFLSWTSVKRIKNGQPDLRNIPAVIGGDPDKRTSIVTAKSIPAKKMGIHTGEPVSMALQKCPDLVVAPPDFAWYRQCSHAFIDICREYAPGLEQFSIDECFLDMSGTQLIYPDPIAIAAKIKDTIHDRLGFTVNVGIGPNKLLAKMASDFEKPDKIHTLWREEIPKKMWPLPVQELLFVGRNAAAVMNRMGIMTIGDLAGQDEKTLTDIFGQKAGHQYWCYANGIDDSPVLSNPEEAKGFSVSTTTEEDIADPEKAHEILRELCDDTAYRMRREGFSSSCIGVRIRTGNFSERVERSHQRKLEEPTNVTARICDIAIELFDELWDHRPFRLLGVSLTDLTHGDVQQIELFPDQKLEKEKKMDKAADAIRAKFGASAIRRGYNTGENRHSKKT